MRKLLFPCLALLITVTVNAQEKKILDHDAYNIWKNIKGEKVSRDGKWVSYQLETNGEGNTILKVSDNKGKEVLGYERGASSVFTFDSKYLVATIKPDVWEDKELRRIKTKKENLPKDSLLIYDLEANAIEKVAGLVSVKVPEKWSDWICYQYELPKDSTSTKKKKSDDKAYMLAIRQLSTGDSFDFPKVTDYILSEEGGTIGFVSMGDSTIKQGVYVFNTKDKVSKPLFRSKGKFQSMAFDKDGDQFVFVSDLDSTKALVRKWALNYWNASMDSSKTIVDSEHTTLSNEWLVNEHFGNNFSEDGKRLFLGLSTYPILEDTTLLPEEIVNVEVWSYTDARLHTQQKIEKKKDAEKAYLAAYHLDNNSLVPLARKEVPDVKLGNEGASNFALGSSNKSYLRERSWEGQASNDLYSINVNSGESKQVATNIRGSAQLSPFGKYAFWYNRIDTAWYTYSFEKEKTYKITDNSTVKYYNEIHDAPSYPAPYGVSTWTENDDRVLIYDRYDIWEVDPENRSQPKKLTAGRTSKITYRYLMLKEEERFIKKGQKLLLEGFNEADKGEGIYEFVYGRSTDAKRLFGGDFAFGSLRQAQESDEILFSKQTFEVFPDLHIADLSFKKPIRISNANPQQGQYNWGTIELYKWTSLDGEELEGMLVKPENFDPGKKYPMIVNFYEKSSNTLNRHRAPSPGRSTMNYSFYASRGYIIFNPNVHYRTGYPGESAYNCVIPGVTSLIEEGFVDKDNIGVQGHSWGGYQIAYLVTKTDIFKCAEAGAPVPNMISAYGGIRWWTGLSRMFQYEHTQSRIGGTLWEYPVRYIENSPIFFVDKINTPLLLMHNDADGHVPWYQGIEFFVALRRLNKPSWMLNYQGEPHWPLKLQNRVDFNIRLAQYFDHYLKGAPMPKWMKSGVPAIEVGINQAYELELPADKKK